MNAIINIAAKLLGLTRLLDKVNGSKAYLGGAGLILTGAATALTGVAGIVAGLLPLGNAAEYMAFLKELAHNSNAGLVAAGVGMISKGLADIGNRHAVAKLEKKIDEKPAQ